MGKKFKRMWLYKYKPEKDEMERQKQLEMQRLVNLELTIKKRNEELEQKKILEQKLLEEQEEKYKQLKETKITWKANMTKIKLESICKKNNIEFPKNAQKKDLIDILKKQDEKYERELLKLQQTNIG